MSADLDVTSAAVLSWLLTYAIHSTILLALPLLSPAISDHHAWLDASGRRRSLARSSRLPQPWRDPDRGRWKCKE